MLPFSSWEVISGTDSQQFILAVDCPGNRGGEAGLAELAALLGDRYRFLRLTQGRDPDPAHLEFESLRQDHRRVAAVLGHRVGSVYAAEIAESVARWQPRPVTILFDPEVASTGLLAGTLDAEFASNSALLSAAEIDRARMVAAEISRRPANGAGIAGEIEAYSGIRKVM